MVYCDPSGREHEVRMLADWERRRQDILRGMQAAMGPLPDRSHLPALDVKIVDESRLDGLIRRTITFVINQHPREERIPAYLFLPQQTGPAHQFPAMLALHPTSPIGKGEAAGFGKPNHAYGLELARRGYVVLCPDYPSFGDYPCNFKDPAFASGTMKGIFNHMRCVDLLQSLPQVDGQRIGAIGHSLGGHNAMFLAAFDPRIKAVVSSCGWTPFGSYFGGNLAGWTSPRYMPRLRTDYHLDPRQTPFDFYEVVAALAPRPFFSSSPLRDDNFAVDGVRKAIPEAQKVYDLLGAREALRVVYPDCTHDFPPQVRQQAYKFLDAALKSRPEALPR